MTRDGGAGQLRSGVYRRCIFEGGEGRGIRVSHLCARLAEEVRYLRKVPKYQH